MFLLRPSVLEPMLWKDCPELSSQDSLFPPPEIFLHFNFPPEIVFDLYFPPEIFFDFNFPPEQRRNKRGTLHRSDFLTTKIVVLKIS